MKSKFIPVFCFILGILMTGNFIIADRACASEPLKIGVLHWGKFPQAEMMKNSYEMALEVLNNTGGIKGQPLKLIYADDRGEREPGEKAVKELKKAGAVMLTGGYASSNTIYSARIADKLDLPFLICTAADDRITQRQWKNVFRLNPPAGEYTKGLEDFLLKNIAPSSAAIVYENSPYGTGSALRMMWFCREHDIEINKIISYHKERAGSDYFRNILSPLKESPPDIIYMVSYLKDGASLVKTIRELGIHSLLCGGAGGFTHSKFIAMAGEAADTLLTATLWFYQSNYSGTKEYYDRYIEKYSAPPDYHGAEAYSAIQTVADVLNRAKSFDPEGIRSALKNTDLVTPFGSVKFKDYGKFGNQNTLPTMVLQIRSNKFESIWPEELASSKFIPPSGWRNSPK